MGKHLRITRIMFLLIVLLLAGCTSVEQTDIPAGTQLYTIQEAGNEVVSGTFTENDRLNYLVVESEYEGFGKVLLYANEQKGTARYFRLSDVPAAAVTDTQEQVTSPVPGTDSSESTSIPSWLKNVVLGQWQIWVLCGLAGMFSYLLYNWTSKTTPKPAEFKFQNIATKRTAFTFTEEITIFTIPARDLDRANTFRYLSGKTVTDKLTTSEDLIRGWLEAAMQDVASTSEPDDVDGKLRTWIDKVNRAVHRVDWTKLAGTVLEGFPECGRDLTRVRVDGFIPSNDMQNFLGKVQEASKHADAIKKLAAALGISTKGATRVYADINKNDALRDVGNSASAIVAAILQKLGG